MAFFEGDGGPDSINGTDNDDEMYGRGGNDTLNGRDDDDYLNGGGGNDRLIGGEGTNDYVGGLGSDRFVMSQRVNGEFSDDLLVDFTFNENDRVDVSAWGVSDFGQIKALLFEDFFFGDAALNAYYGGEDHFITFNDIEPEQLDASDFVFSSAGSKDETGTGNDDVLFGSKFADTLRGAGGWDDLLGGGGNDLLIGGSGFDYFNGGAGNDRVSYAYTDNDLDIDLADGFADLGTFDEELDSIESAIGSTGDNEIVGTSGANTLTGLAGDDTINGRAGNDRIAGGAGADRFTFNTPLGVNNIDTIVDYSGADGFRLDGDDVFTTLPNGTLAASAYAEGNFSSAQDASDRIIYNTVTGGVFYDPDGAGGLASRQFALLDPGLQAILSNSDFFVT